MLGGLIGGALGLVGSVIGKNQDKKAQAAQNAYNEQQSDPATIREKFEAAGFNPLLGLNGWTPPQQNGFVPSSIGTAVSEAGAVFGSYFDNKAKEKSALTLAEQENQKLKDRLRDATLRPVVGGIFGGGDRPLASVSGPAILGQDAIGDDTNPTASGGWFDRPLEEKPRFDNRREMDNAPMKSTSGFMVVDNPNLPFNLYAPTLDGDEAMQWYDYPSLVMPTVIGAGVKAYDLGKDYQNRRWKDGLIEGYKQKDAEKASLTMRRRSPYNARQARVAGY